jgi:hypothetical protein
VQLIPERDLWPSDDDEDDTSHPYPFHNAFGLGWDEDSLPSEGSDDLLEEDSDFDAFADTVEDHDGFP